MCHHPKRFSEDCIDFNMHEEKEIKESEKPAPNTLEEVARLYAIPHYMKDIDVNHIDEYPYDPVAEKAFIAGAQWDKEQFEKNRLAHCDTVSKEDYDRETDFAMEIIEKEHRQPTFSDAINYGMRLQKEQMGEQARQALAKTDITLADLVAFDEGCTIGRRLERQQMLKDAVEADVYAYKAPRFNCGFAEFVVAIPSAETDKLGDKVKLIIVKEDEK